MLSSHDSAAALAERAEQLFEQLLHHLARLVGPSGTMTLFKRAVAVASPRLPWLAAAATAAPAQIVPALRAALERQDPATIVEAFAAVLSDFTRLLQKLIGASLVRRLLEEIWPQAFPIEKESA